MVVYSGRIDRVGSDPTNAGVADPKEAAKNGWLLFLREIGIRFHFGNLFIVANVMQWDVD